MNNFKLKHLLLEEFYSISIQTIIKSVVGKFIEEIHRTEKILVTEKQRVIKINKLLTGEKPSCQLCVGFPFPIEIYHQDIIYDNLIIKYFIQGEYLRNLQTIKLEKFESIEFEKIGSIEFENLAAKKIENKFDEFIFIEPYKFIGDSYISLQVFDFIKPYVT
jgi:hypothetical protein